MLKELKSNKAMDTFILSLFVMGICCIIYFHHVLEMDIVFTHLFYIPIIVSAIYWKKKGFIIAVSFALVLVVSQLIAQNSSIIIDILRASVFIFTSIITILLSQQYDKLQNDYYNLKFQESENKFKIFVDNTYDWEYWKNRDGTFVYMSPSCKRISGYDREDFLNDNKKFESIVFEEDKQKYSTHIQSIWQENSKGVIDFRIVHKNGGIIWINMNNTLIKDDVGNIIGLRGSNREITERKEYEQKITELNKQLNEQLITKDKFFSIIAHDLRSPFSGFLGLTELMKEMNLLSLAEEEFKEISLNLNQSAKSLFGLLENLLEWSRFQRGMIQFNPENISIKALIDSIIDVQKSTLSNKNLTINNLVDENVIYFVDVSMFGAIIRNLFSNSIKFTPKGGNIDFDIIEDKTSSTLLIRDNGIGIPKDMIDKMFKLEHKISRLGTDGEPSSGLGLILCKEYVTKHNGEIWVTSQEGIGSTFYVKLPKISQS